MKKLFLNMLVIIALCALLAGCQCLHNWDAATCLSPKTCSKCGETEGDVADHHWVAATCTTPKTCSVCSATEGEALGHSITDWKTVSASTCVVAGSEKGQCSTCGEYIMRELALAEHTSSDWIITVEPTQSSKGTRVKTCKVCDKELQSEQFELSAEEIEARYKKNCKKISYKDLARSPDKYKGELVKFTGYVVQVCNEASSSLYYSTYRVATSGRYDNVVYIYVDNYGSGERILEDDKITFYGEYDGLYSYTTVLGSSLTIPSIKVEYID